MITLFRMMMRRWGFEDGGVVPLAKAPPTNSPAIDEERFIQPYMSMGQLCGSKKPVVVWWDGKWWATPNGSTPPRYNDVRVVHAKSFLAAHDWCEARNDEAQRRKDLRKRLPRIIKVEGRWAVARPTRTMRKMGINLLAYSRAESWCTSRNFMAVGETIRKFTRG